MKRNTALLIAAMATVFVSTTAFAVSRALSHNLTDSQPVVSKTKATAAPTTATAAATTLDPVVVTRVENEDVLVVVPSAPSVAVTPGAPSPQVRGASVDATNAAPVAATRGAVEPAESNDDAAEHAAAPAGSTPAVSAPSTTDATEVEHEPAPAIPPNDEMRTGGGKGGKGLGPDDHHFDTGGTGSGDD